MTTNLQFRNIYSVAWFASERKLTRALEQEKFRNEHQDLFESLTKRELEIIVCITQGLYNPQIAKKLFISRNTVEQHRKNINRKLSIRSFSELFYYALAFDLI